MALYLFVVTCLVLLGLPFADVQMWSCTSSSCHIIVLAKALPVHLNLLSNGT